MFVSRFARLVRLLVEDIEVVAEDPDRDLVAGLTEYLAHPRLRIAHHLAAHTRIRRRHVLDRRDGRVVVRGVVDAHPHGGRVCADRLIAEDRLAHLCAHVAHAGESAELRGRASR